jgi:hypothetical protein
VVVVVVVVESGFLLLVGLGFLMLRERRERFRMSPSIYQRGHKQSNKGDDYIEAPAKGVLESLHQATQFFMYTCTEMRCA